MGDQFIVRAGFRSTAIGVAGMAIVDIAGTFTKEDCEDCIALLEMSIRQIRRQMAAHQPRDLVRLPLKGDMCSGTDADRDWHSPTQLGNRPRCPNDSGNYGGTRDETENQVGAGC